ncbi:hypothetical protein QO002_000983 [Pararhizobium capsulatum DSM 1112]|uniref:Uncharacterized protein n=1 Tax=Pararhizobium capsulatum DSM 1112 TaxID=1121113 RepID=A0ABU0BN23_9HYPH|nr:hypothetical protein [Pararhizobium capsulatum DSM 1112]
MHKGTALSGTLMLIMIKSSLVLSLIFVAYFALK